MHTQAGVWIDHKRAILVLLHDGKEDITEIPSNIEKHVRYAGGSTSGSTEGIHEPIAEDKRDRKYMNHLKSYYEEVTTSMRDADAILIVGPGEAKGELKKHLESSKRGASIVGVEAADKMTNNEIVAKVRKHYLQKTCC